MRNIRYTHLLMCVKCVTLSDANGVNKVNQEVKKMEPTEWLDQAKKKLLIESDYKLAKVLGITPSGISTIRKRNAGIDLYTASRLEDVLELERMTIIIDLEIQKEKNEEKKKYWKKKAQIYLDKNIQ